MARDPRDPWRMSPEEHILMEARIASEMIGHLHRVGLQDADAALQLQSLLYAGFTVREVSRHGQLIDRHLAAWRAERASRAAA